jgi:hypothetical protein
VRATSIHIRRFELVFGQCDQRGELIFCRETEGSTQGGGDIALVYSIKAGRREQNALMTLF